MKTTDIRKTVQSFEDSPTTKTQVHDQEAVKLSVDMHVQSTLEKVPSDDGQKLSNSKVTFFVV